MKTISLVPRTVNTRDLVKRTALEEDTEILYKEPGIYCVNGVPKIIYGSFLDKETLPLKWAVKTIKYHTGKRTLGLTSTSRIFGFRPRITIRQDFCSSSSMSMEHPKQHEIIAKFGEEFSLLYAQHAPKAFLGHREQVVNSVRKDWIMPNTIFTSGIVNKNNPLKYHFDAGNFKDCMSCMVVFRKDIDGGRLSIPEFNCKFELEDNSFFLFDGQSILHGVTPIKRLRESSYRYSVVYYSLQQIKHCLPADEECKRIRSIKKNRENKRMMDSKEKA